MIAARPAILWLGIVMVMGCGVNDVTLRDPCAPVATFTTGMACGKDSVLADDGRHTGLDYAGGGGCDVTLGDLKACACVGLDLGVPRQVREIELVVRPVTNACGRGCGIGCGTGHTVAVGAGASDVSYELVQDQPLPPGVSRFRYDWSREARFVVACRITWGQERDDVEVDLLRAVCAKP